eukprot:COSAG06_NODE_55407_length_289_cov_1.610526_1_plen_28_part_01
MSVILCWVWFGTSSRIFQCSSAFMVTTD